MELVRWGIVGVGDVCEVKSGPAFQKAPGSELVAVMRRNAAKARDFALRHQVPRSTGDASELLAMPDIDAVYIATPPAFHLDYAKQALAAGKHVYLEKPMAMDAGECGDIILAEKASGRKVAIAHYRRMMPAFRKVGELVANGAIGKPARAEIRISLPTASGVIASSETSWRLDPAISGGGLFHDLAPHQLDLMCLYFGNPVEVSGGSERCPDDAPCDTLVRGQILFDSDVKFEGHWDFCAAPEDEREECVITGDRGSIRFGFFGSEVTLQSEDQRGHRVFKFEPLDHVQQPMIEAVNEYFRGNSPCPCSTRDGLRVMEIIDRFTGNAL